MEVDDCIYPDDIHCKLSFDNDKPSPKKIFYKLGDFENLCKYISQESRRYAMENGRKFDLDGKDVEVFFGILFYMGLVKLPSIRDYWRSDELGQLFIKFHMTRDRFEEIWRNLHFSDNNDISTEEDKARKVRPIISNLNFCYQNDAENEARQSIDELMIKFKGHLQMKQYIKNKPIKWGFKVWERCRASSAYLYEFDIYTGRKNQPEFGLGEQVVLQLTRSLQNSNVRIFCDNYFASPALCTALLNNGIYLTGVVRPN